MELQGTWTKDEEGYMQFESSELQRYYERITDSYHRIYNRYLDEFDDDEDAYEKALEDGYEMITDYKLIDGNNEFATSYITPSNVLDVWYEVDEASGKKRYDRGFLRIQKK